MKWKVLIYAAALGLVSACSTTRSLRDGEYILRETKIVADDASFRTSSLANYINQKPNTYFFGVNPFLMLYSAGGKGETWLGRFIHKLGEPPVIYDAFKVQESVYGMENHLVRNGYFGSQVESKVEVKGRKVYVTYYVALGKRYKISSINYDIPTYGTFKEDFEKDLPNVSLKKGQYLSEIALDQEAARSAQYFRTVGYYGFTKSFYSFEADTLASNGKAKLTMRIRDYALGDLPESAQPHLKYSIGNITISHPEKLRIRQSVLENLNMLRPGQLYDEREINTTYSRFASVSMLSGVNINMTPVSDNKVDCDINLRNGRLQGFKTSLEASVNSTGLFGISPQLTYYHKNAFHGGEIWNIGIKGNFQFKPGDSAYSTEVSLSSSLRFPKALGLPNHLFDGPHIPRTDITASFSYQDRPEYQRTMISYSISYSGRWGNRISYQFAPFQANVVRLFDIDQSFLTSLKATNPYILSAYNDHFDLGIGGTLYYTTDNSTIPTVPYHYIRLSGDVSGNVVALFKNLMPVNADGQHTIWDTPFSQYVKGELHLGKVFRFGYRDLQSLALHLMGGAGLAYGNSNSLPIEKQFYAGGSMSMRGWQARTLGPGNSQMITQFAIPSQIADMKLEANIEYRFPLFWKLEGALFTDVGNIWDINVDADEDTDGASFDYKKFGESLGADWGLGIRVNLSLLLIRVDAGVKVHDPALAQGARWIAPKNWLHNDNYAIHFGVGYPF